MTETWLPVPGWAGLYEVSDLGRVRSLERKVMHPSGPRTVHQRILKAPVGKNGYPSVTLWRDNTQTRVTVHRLVLLAFVGPPAAGQEACHSNAVRTDARLANLRWDTSRENKLDQVRIGGHYWAKRTHCQNGHEFTPDNTRWVTRKDRDTRARICITCARESDRLKARAKYVPRPRDLGWLPPIAALNKAKTHCLRGHEFTDENTHVRKNGTRCCRRCNADRASGRLQGAA